MRIISLLCFLVVTALSVSCEKEEEKIGNDQELQKFWKLKGFFDSNDNPIHKPAFNADTIFHYEVNIQILWNNFSEKYEIQGQAPFDLYWGEFKSLNNSIKLLSLETTHLTPGPVELINYDSVFFHALHKVSSYKIANNELTLFYEQGTKKMIFTLKDQQYADQQANLTAQINQMDWKPEESNIKAHIIYNDNTKTYNLDFGGLSQDILVDGFRYDISFSINRQPQRGEFHFNNNGFTLESAGGVMGICYGRYKDQDVVDARSKNGVVAITLINRSFIEGYFYFDAEGVSGKEGTINKVTNGKFLIPLNPVSGWFKTYHLE